MKCLVCKQELEVLDNPHLVACCGLTLQEYAIKHHVSLDYLVNPDMISCDDAIEAYLPASEKPSATAYSILRGLSLVGAFEQKEPFTCIQGEVRRLEQLLWYLQSIKAFGFRFRQEYEYTDTSHRVIAKNRLKIPSKLLQDTDAKELEEITVLATMVAHAGEYHNGYLFLPLELGEKQQKFLTQLTQNHQIRFKPLDDYQGSGQCFGESSGRALLRCESREDTKRLLTLVEPVLRKVPCASERFYAPVDEALVCKEMVFDSAHFITDHPDKCENLHGGRYAMNVKVKGRIDPLTGFVIDYGYLKAVVKNRVIEKLDHQNLNYVCTDLAWRSSTELLSIYIWEQLIDYLPGLCELQIFETTQSYCSYVGPCLEEYQRNGAKTALKHFNQESLGTSPLRDLLKEKVERSFKVVASKVEA